MTDYAIELRGLLEEHGIQQKELARELGISAVAVNRRLGSGRVTSTTYHRYREAILTIALRRLMQLQTELPEEIEINGERYRKVKT